MSCQGKHICCLGRLCGLKEEQHVQTKCRNLEVSLEFARRSTRRRFSSFQESPHHFHSTHDPLSVAVLEESPPNLRIRTPIDAPIGYLQPLNRPRLRDRSLHRYSVLISPCRVVIAEVRRIRTCLRLINGTGPAINWFYYTIDICRTEILDEPGSMHFVGVQAISETEIRQDRHQSCIAQCIR